MSRRIGLRTRSSFGHRPAMTLVELMLAVALSAMLLSALIGVLGGVSKHVRSADSLDTAQWPARVTELIRNDLIAAEAIWVQGDTVWLRTSPPNYGFGEVGTRSIGYRCGEITDERFALLRIDGSRSDVLAIGPTSFVLERLDESGVPQPLPGIPGPVPVQIRFWVVGERPDDPVFVSDVVVR